MPEKFLFNYLPKAFSYLLHPLLMPLIGLFILFNSGTYISFFPAEFKRSVFLIVGICSLGIPLVFIPFFIYKKVITDVYLESSRERVIPLAITSLMIYFSYYLLRNTSVPKTLQMFLLGSSVCVFITMLISIKWKISAHMIGLGGIVGLIIGIAFFLHSNMMVYLMMFILFSGLAGSSRLLLNCHSPAQVYSGFWLGFLIIFSFIFIF